MIQISKYFLASIIIMMAAVLLAALVCYYLFTPRDTLSVRQLDARDEQLSYIKKLENENGSFPPHKSSERKYIKIYIDGKNCVWGLYDPPIPINADNDDIYCFNKSDGVYLGKI